MQSFQPARSRISGFLFGAGLTGFLGRGLTEITLWFGTAQTLPRPRDGLSYPVVEHGKTYYVSATEMLLHSMIFVFWLLFALGLLLMPAQRDAGGKRRLKDPTGLYARWRWIGAAACLLFMLASHLFATVLTGPAPPSP